MSSSQLANENVHFAVSMKMEPSTAVTVVHYNFRSNRRKYGYLDVKNVLNNRMHALCCIMPYDAFYHSKLCALCFKAKQQHCITVNIIFKGFSWIMSQSSHASFATDSKDECSVERTQCRSHYWRRMVQLQLCHTVLYLKCLPQPLPVVCPYLEFLLLFSQGWLAQVHSLPLHPLKSLCLT